MGSHTANTEWGRFVGYKPAAIETPSPEPEAVILRRSCDAEGTPVLRIGIAVSGVDLATAMGRKTKRARFYGGSIYA